MNVLTPLSDKDLLDKVRKGDRQAFKSLHQTLAGPLLLFAEKLTQDKDLAEEIVQETFVNVWVNREKLGEVKSPKSYLFGIAKNGLLMHFRKQKLSQKLLCEMDYEDVDHLTPMEAYTISELADLRHSAIESLPEKKKLVFKMSRENAMTYHEIALETGLSEVAVKKQMMGALHQLRTFLRKNSDLVLFLLYCFFQ